mmetsp:Transcript_23042/g.76422  ORF Transcript_23042/g.76422 Transcript_23042/m.76422 type:complete len:231 (+) Transcript_23042:826-1518(+)
MGSDRGARGRQASAEGVPRDAPPLASSVHRATGPVEGRAPLRPAGDGQDALGKGGRHRVQHRLLQHFGVLHRLQVAGRLGEARACPFRPGAPPRTVDHLHRRDRLHYVGARRLGRARGLAPHEDGASGADGRPDGERGPGLCPRRDQPAVGARRGAPAPAREAGPRAAAVFLGEGGDAPEHAAAREDPAQRGHRRPCGSGRRLLRLGPRARLQGGCDEAAPQAPPDAGCR